MADVAHADDVIEPTEREFIHSVIEFGDTVVREVMVPRPDMVTVAHDDTATAALERGLAAGFSRLPVLGEDVDDVLGIAFTKDLVQVERSGGGDRPVATAMRPAKFVPETKRVRTLLAEMQTENVHLAIVVDEYGGTAGLITLEDVLEELVGDIRDEFDIEEPEVTHRADGIVVVSGRMSIDEVDELLDEPLPEGQLGHRRRPRLRPRGRRPGRGPGPRLAAVPIHRRARRGAARPAGPHRAARRQRARAHVRSGFVALVGRPNVGKSTLLNRLVGEKVSITAATPNTTRHSVRGVVRRAGGQLVVVDTPGLHRPKTALGQRLNHTALAALEDVDAIVAMVEATEQIGPGDRRVLGHALAASARGAAPFVVVNKRDAARRATVAERLLSVRDAVEALATSEGVAGVAERVEYFAVSAATGDGVDELCDAVAATLPEGPKWFPDDVVSDLTEATGSPSSCESSSCATSATSSRTRSTAASPPTSGR